MERPSSLSSLSVIISSRPEIQLRTAGSSSSWLLVDVDVELDGGEIFHCEEQRMRTDHGGLCLHLSHFSHRLRHLGRAFLPAHLPAHPDRVV